MRLYGLCITFSDDAPMTFVGDYFDFSPRGCRIEYLIKKTNTENPGQMTCRTVLTYKPPVDVEHWVEQLVGERFAYDLPLVDWVRKALRLGDIKVVPEPRAVTVRKFEMNWVDGKGTFKVALNGVELDERFICSVEGDGWLHCWHPHVQAPIGLHPDYPCYIFTEATKLAIEQAVRKVLPRLKPWGLDRSSGKMLNALSSLHERGISSRNQLEARSQIALPTFAVSVRID